MPRPHFNRPFAVLFSTVAGSVAGGAAGYHLGEARTARRLENLINDPMRAMSVVLRNEFHPTWRPKFHAADPKITGGRDGAWVSPFKARFTGAIAFVVFHNKKDNQTYVLQTFQNRVIDKQVIMVAESPAGYFNDKFYSKHPHPVVEAAERRIDQAYAMGTPISQEQAYREAAQKYRKGQLPAEEYVVDESLAHTAVREVEEEAGLSIRKIEADSAFKVEKSSLGNIERDGEIIAVQMIEISGATLPRLAKVKGDEVLRAEWIPVQNFDLLNKKVTASSGSVPIKPFLGDLTDKVINRLRRAEMPQRTDSGSAPNRVNLLKI